MAEKRKGMLSGEGLDVFFGLNDTLARASGS